MSSIILFGGGLTCLAGAGVLYISGKEKQLRLKGLDVEADVLKKVEKLILPVLLGGVLVYMIVTFPFSVFVQ